MHASKSVLPKAMASLVVLLPLAAIGQTFSTVHVFAGSPDGAKPNELFYSGGRLYGTTSGGGTAGLGSVFEIDRNGAETVLHSFAGASDGSVPYAGVTDYGFDLVGTTVFGGTVCAGNGCGTIYRISARGAESVLYSFAGGTDGELPEAHLIDVGGQLYGTTALGGASGLGTVFKFDPENSRETVVHSFSGGDDGQNPSAALVRVGRYVYGTTAGGGSAGLGTVFKIDVQTGTETLVHTFTGTDGAQPLSALIASGCKLYGTTFAGGASSQGTVFEIDTFSGAETVLHSFGGSDGANPLAALVEEDGSLYGTTYSGGTAGSGTLFRVDTWSGELSSLYSFSGGTDGANPAAPMIDVGGILYGTTSKGGSSTGAGTVFRFIPSHHGY
jgi:uncharacterized repeat protein (TIGR03803 family)